MVYRTARPVEADVADAKRVIALLVGLPKDINHADHDKKQQSTTKFMTEEFKKFKYNEHQLHHRRAACPAVDRGVSFGGGQRVSFFRPFPTSH